jgi:hypothetical protein
VASCLGFPPVTPGSGTIRAHRLTAAS